MIRLLLFCIMFMFSCSEFEEHEAILDYTYYIHEGWVAFETINLDDLSDDNSYYYDLALEMFNTSIQAIESEFSDQSLLGPYYQSYNGLGWSYLYYAGEFLGPNYVEVRDSLRNTSKTYFDLAIDDLHNSEFDNISNQDSCDIYLGLAYTNYYTGLASLNFDSSLQYSDDLLNLNPLYSFEHDQLDYRNVHYLRGKIFLKTEDYDQACFEIDKANPCDCATDEGVDMNVLIQCFDNFANGD